MKKYYGQITKTFLRTAFFAALILIIGGILVYFAKAPLIGIAEAVIGALILAAVAVFAKKRKKCTNNYLNILAKSSNSISANLMGSFPIPVIVAQIDGSVYWYNEKFSEFFFNKDLFGAKIDSVISDIKWGEILKSASHYEKNIKIGDNRYLLIATTIRNRNIPSAEDEDKVSVYIYLIDKTEETKLQRMYNNDKTDIAIINIDNYDDVLQRVNDSEQQHILIQIRRCVNEWAAEANSLVKSTDRDRYYVLFEHRYLAEYVGKKFDILYKVRKVGEDIKLPVSISIGIGTGGNLTENDAYARSALDMALGRGGDQVSIKDDTQYKFYGSKARDYEKSTRVKTRATAVALKDFIKNSDKVIFMGHSGADYDSFGAAMGLQRAVRALNKKPYIIYDNNSPAIKILYDDLKVLSEYKGMFISGDDALEILTPDSLVVILDTHRPSMLPCPALAERAAKVVLIDHHRRSTDFISPCSLVYHEPYASSTCEMATELLEYMNLGSALTSEEAESMYTGILMDTKNFIVKTGVRTFEAASYLRRLGLNTVDIKKLFNVSKEDYDRRADIVKTARVVAPHIAVALTYAKFPNIKVIASQAADEMLNITGIYASIVVYPLDNSVGLSARSLGDINVQLIMEYLGGGGHSTVAGAQIKDRSVDMAVDDVINAVNEYLKSNDN
ncbi:MAG: DHH family phosphoesterase [Firmicutes bacterium]|nr:DHH family phosphoesterase [Bacillota bacterium]